MDSRYLLVQKSMNHAHKTKESSPEAHYAVDSVWSCAWLMGLAKSLNEDNEVVLQHVFTGASSVAWKAAWDKTQECLLEKETNWLINFAFLAVLAGWICLKKSRNEKEGFFWFTSKDGVVKTVIHGYIYIGKLYEYLFLFYFNWIFPKDEKAFVYGENLIIQSL